MEQLCSLLAAVPLPCPFQPRAINEQLSAGVLPYLNPAHTFINNPFVKFPLTTHLMCFLLLPHCTWPVNWLHQNQLGCLLKIRISGLHHKTVSRSETKNSAIYQVILIYSQIREPSLVFLAVLPRQHRIMSQMVEVKEFSPSLCRCPCVTLGNIFICLSFGFHDCEGVHGCYLILLFRGLNEVIPVKQQDTNQLPMLP